MPKAKPLPRKTFSMPSDILAFVLKIKKDNKRRSLQDAFEDMSRMAMKNLTTK